MLRAFSRIMSILSAPVHSQDYKETDTKPSRPKRIVKRKKPKRITKKAVHHERPKKHNHKEKTSSHTAGEILTGSHSSC